MFFSNPQTQLFASEPMGAIGKKLQINLHVRSLFRTFAAAKAIW
jgi:hypothetical protein